MASQPREGVRSRVLKRVGAKDDESIAALLIGSTISEVLIWAVRATAVLAVADIWGVI